VTQLQQLGQSAPLRADARASHSPRHARDRLSYHFRTDVCNTGIQVVPGFHRSASTSADLLPEAGFASTAATSIDRADRRRSSSGHRPPTRPRKQGGKTAKRGRLHRPMAIQQPLETIKRSVGGGEGFGSSAPGSPRVGPDPKGRVPPPATAQGAWMLHPSRSISSWPNWRSRMPPGRATVPWSSTIRPKICACGSLSQRSRNPGLLDERTPPQATE